MIVALSCWPGTAGRAPNDAGRYLDILRRYRISTGVSWKFQPDVHGILRTEDQKVAYPPGYDNRLKSWMIPFHGVATQYLAHYLGWRRMLERYKTQLDCMRPAQPHSF